MDSARRVTAFVIAQSGTARLHLSCHHRIEHKVESIGWLVIDRDNVGLGQHVHSELVVRWQRVRQSVNVLKKVNNCIR